MSKNIIFLTLLITIVTASAFFTSCAGSSTVNSTQSNATPAITPVASTTSLAAIATTTASAMTATNTTPAQPDARQILKNALQAIIAARKYRIQESVNMDVTSSASFISPAITFNIDGAFDKVKNQNLLSMAMIVDMGKLQGKQTINFNIFRMTDYIYVKIDAGSQSIPWVKTRPTAKLIDELNADMVEKDFNSMDSPAEANYITDEVINGASYYVITYVPSSDYLRQNIGDQVGADSGIEWAKITDIRSLFKKLSYKVWIDKKTGYIYKMEFAFNFSLTKDLFINTADAQNISADISGALSFNDFNVEFEVNLPSEAQNAKEVSPDDIVS